MTAVFLALKLVASKQMSVIEARIERGLLVVVLIVAFEMVKPTS